jgi:CBS domain containing-hemolysin-like protein
MQRDLMDRVMNISRTAVSAVMIPRERAAMVAQTIGRDDFLRIARMAHFSRLPVHDGNPRHVIGVVDVYDIFTDPERQPLQAHVRPPCRLAAATSVAAALLRMQQAHQAMAIVEDARGNCVGILTLKDLAEEIIGDIEAW